MMNRESVRRVGETWWGGKEKRLSVGAPRGAQHRHG